MHIATSTIPSIMLAKKLNAKNTMNIVVQGESHRKGVLVTSVVCVVVDGAALPRMAW